MLQAEPAELATFSFGGLVPGMPVEAAIKAGIVTDDCATDSYDCTFEKYLIAGRIKGYLPQVVFTDGKFDWFAFLPDSEDYAALLAIMTEAYGKPCKVESKPLQNAFGATFSGDAAQWCFAEGHLTLRRHSGRKDQSATRGDLSFFPYRPAPDLPPSTPATL